MIITYFYILYLKDDLCIYNKSIKILYNMKDKYLFSIIGTFSIIATSIPIYNYYLIPVFRHNEMMSKIDEIDKRLKKIEK